VWNDSRLRFAAEQWKWNRGLSAAFVGNFAPTFRRRGMRQDGIKFCMALYPSTIVFFYRKENFLRRNGSIYTKYCNRWIVFIVMLAKLSGRLRPGDASRLSQLWFVLWFVNISAMHWKRMTHKWSTCKDVFLQPEFNNWEPLARPAQEATALSAFTSALQNRARNRHTHTGVRMNKGMLQYVQVGTRTTLRKQTLTGWQMPR